MCRACCSTCKGINVSKEGANLQHEEKIAVQASQRQELPHDELGDVVRQVGYHFGERPFL